MKYTVEHMGKVYEVEVEVHADSCVVRGPDGVAQRIAWQTRADGSQRALTPWGDLEIVSARRGDELWAQVSGRRLQARAARTRPSATATSGGTGVGSVCAPMAGRLLRIDVKQGDLVRAGQALAVIEAMKMENELLAPLDGMVSQVAVQAPAAVEKGAVIVTIEPS
jgi:glutaconyl-CoA/methylmalonyl-CoA decarboxylase subunit gamma